MCRVGVGVSVLLCSTSLAWSQAAQPVAPVVNNAAVTAGNPLPVTGTVSVVAPLDTNATVYLGGSPVATGNPFPSATIVGGAAVSSSNPLPSVVFVGGLAASFANPFPSGISISGAAVTFANPIPEAPTVAGAAVSTSNPLPTSLILGGSTASSTNPVPTAANLNSRMYAAATASFARSVSGDVLCLTGSASKAVKVKSISASTSSSASTIIDLALILRSTLDTGGTPSTLTNVPLDSSNAAATAVVTAYATAPTTGTSTGMIAVQKYTAVSTMSPQLQPTAIRFAVEGVYDQPVTLNGATQAICLNVGAVASGSWNISVAWSEE